MAVREDRYSTGSVGVQYASDSEWNQKKMQHQLQYQLQQYLLRSAQAMYVPSLVWKEDSVSSGPGEWIRQSTGVDSSGSVCGRSYRVWIVS